MWVIKSLLTITHIALYDANADPLNATRVPFWDCILSEPFKARNTINHECYLYY